MATNSNRQSLFHWYHILWILAYPLYQIIGTIRHEGAHALAALLEGATITEFVFLPTRKTDGSTLWGYVNWVGDVSWFATAAPYIVDLLTFVLVLCLLFRLRVQRPSLWLNILAIGIFSPLLNSAYNYQALFFGHRSINDVGKLAQMLSAEYIHLYFITTITAYILGIVYVVLHQRPA